MALNKLRGGLKAYWAEKSDSGSAQMYGNYGERFDIIRQEFEDIRTHLKLTPYTAADVVRVIDYKFINSWRIRHEINIIYVLFLFFLIYLILN